MGFHDDTIAPLWIVEGMIFDLIRILCGQVELFEHSIVVRGEKDLHAKTMKFEQKVDNSGKELGIQIGFWLIPEENRTTGEGAILDQQPKQAQLAQTFSQKCEFQLTTLILEKEFLSLD